MFYFIRIIWNKEMYVGRRKEILKSSTGFILILLLLEILLR